MSNTKITLYRIPNSLRNKTVNSRISREIFFLDCLNDLNQCANSGHIYNIIRSSVLIRMLLLDNGIETIRKNYSGTITFEANSSVLNGSALSNTQIRKNKPQELIRNFTTTSSFSKIELLQKPFKNYDQKEFINKVCISIKNETNLNFSIQNIINLIANKHGAAHLEASFDSSELEAFHFNDFNPLSLKKDNQFIKCLRNIIIVTLNSLKLLSKEIERNLEQHDKKYMQYSHTQTVEVISRAEYDKRNKDCY